MTLTVTLSLSKGDLMNLAIFAGAGELPAIAVKNARARGLDFVLYHITEAELDASLTRDPALKLRTISLGAIGKTFAYLKEDKITDIVLLGKIEKQRLLQDVQRDAAADKIYNAATDRRDDTLFLEFAKGIALMGIGILKQKDLLEGCFLTPGVHTQKQPEGEKLLADIEFGYALSKKVGSLDIGQTAIVYEKMILAVEAIEGTDAAIARAGAILNGGGSRKDAPRAQREPDASMRAGVVCKTGKASQDPRFDLPAVGIRTLETMAASGMQALVIEAAQTLVVNPQAFIRRADELGLIVLAK